MTFKTAAELAVKNGKIFSNCQVHFNAISGAPISNGLEFAYEMHNNFSSLAPALMLLHLPLHFLYDFDLNLDATYCCTSKLTVDRKTLMPKTSIS